MRTRPPGLPDGTRAVLRGGRLTAEEQVAVLLAVDAAAAWEAAGAAPPARRPAWITAARREAVGGPRVATRADLRPWDPSS